MQKPFFVLTLLLAGISVQAQVAVTNLLTENRPDPIGLDAPKPRFSWQLTSDKRNEQQTAYELKVEDGHGKVWGSGKVTSGQSVQVSYGGLPLRSGKKYTWQVRVWDNFGATSLWSRAAFFQTGLLDTADWKASWIQPGYPEDSLRASPLFRKQFSAAKKIASATAYVTAHGLYEARINGKKIGDGYLTPGWTSYHNRLQYQTYDVTSLLKDGRNAIGVTLGSGWYRGIIGFTNSINVYGKDIALLFQLDIRYEDGSEERIMSDDTWKSSTGSIVYAEIYNGETIDARKEKEGWLLPGYDDGAWAAVKVADFSKANLIASQDEPVKKHETFTPVRIFTTPAGEKVIDFGQNLVGWVMMTVSGKAGDKVTLSHAEVLDKLGNFYTLNLREAKAQDTYILKGGGAEKFEPHFTWQGFRYVKVEGFPGELKAENFTAVALYSDMRPSGTFVTLSLIHI